MALLGVAVSTSCLAAAPHDWQFEVTPHLHAAGMEGTAGVRGVEADVGAGGSDLSYQAIAGVNWQFAERYTAKLGYRHMYWDYEDGGTVWDMTASGPYLGMGIRF